ncbi:ArsR family transcriptional regulator [Mangrovibacter sp. MFB070]|uniref:ArsR/SmtB family transcription factor n=1 Tax=Mangrovibacter sp. MFB070 TaxID=1224318 RepID=UPI0004DA8715|nr:metalloregulator ArsR/SmtB family transcription factor [Mangrovibacter sp. MFB070]KEA50477.1 ArsR family transcriptional regulator [Mangrovibacter sp. MFB070]
MTQIQAQTTLPDTQPISVEQRIAEVASAISDASRATMLCALMDGRAWTATELSATTHIAASTASAHLAKLLKSGLVQCVTQGRHRYYRLAGHDIAALLESMMCISTQQVQAPESRAPVLLRHARTCYDHLAGEVAVKIYQVMHQAEWITPDGSTLTPKGTLAFLQAGITLNTASRRKPCTACLDWSERQFHAGGEVGAALLRTFEQNNWLVRTPGYREVTITAAGEKALQRIFNFA